MRLGVNPFPLSFMRTYLLPIVVLLSIPVAASAAFKDVPADHPNAEAIAYVKAVGIVQGYPDGTYRPNAAINRAEFVKIMVSANLPAHYTYDQFLKYDSLSTDCFNQIEGTDDGEFVFSDVSITAWYALPICRAYENFWIRGYPDGTFRPAAQITFAEAAKILNELMMFPSVDPKGEWYEPYVRILEERRAIPLSITRFDQVITRGEMAEMIWRLKAGVTDKESTTYSFLELMRECDDRIRAGMGSCE